MREFDRITIDPNVANGLPCIRDTGITVSEVVKAIQSRKSTSDIFEMYAELNIEDLLEIQRYAISDLIRSITLFQNDSINALSIIHTYAGIIANTDEHVRKDEQASSGSAISQAVESSKSAWHNLEAVAKTYGE